MDAYQVDESTFCPLREYGLLVRPWSVVVLEFDNRFHRDKSLRTCWNGRWMLSLQCLLYPFILLSKPVLVLLFAVTGESRPFCNTALLLKSSAPPSQYTLLTDRAL